MPFKPGQSGNPNGSQKSKPWYDALNRAIAQDDGKRLRAAAEKLLDEAANGEGWAIKELGDRLDGKAVQAIEAEVDGNLTIEVVRFAGTPAE